MSAPPVRLRGDEAQLYERLGARLERAVRARIGGPAATVEDACAFAWEQLLRTQPARGEQLFTWLVRVAEREGWRLVRIERRTELLPTSELDGLAGADAELANRQAALEALRALAALRPLERRLLALLVAGYSYRELMAIEHSSYTRINRHLTRGRRRLRDRTRAGGED